MVLVHNLEIMFLSLAILRLCSWDERSWDCWDCAPGMGFVRIFQMGYPSVFYPLLGNF